MVEEMARKGYELRAATYRDARPTYHRSIIDEVVDVVGDGLVVELGAGTGIFTRELVRVGIRVIAVEPIEAMRQQLITQLGSVDVRAGSAESIPVDSGAADAAVAAQAFHWFDFDTALDEIARVLRPGGKLLTVWNVRDESVRWVGEYTRVVEEHAGDTPRHHTMIWRHAIESDTRFTLAAESAVDNPQPTDTDGVVARALSTSFIAALSPADQGRVASRIREVVASLGDRFDYPYRCELQVWSFQP